MAPVHRTDLETRERRFLSPLAQFSGDSRGRAHREAPPEWRTEFQRDRDRVIHSRAFRRLEYKTQVFLNGTGDHLRTRLTHTMEVAAISRNIARALGLNEDLAETIALAHDLGHSPFGHTGEHRLDRLMRGHGGFEHNRQSLRVVDILERKYPRFPGLNLTWEVREGLAKHDDTFALPAKGPQFPYHQPSLEAQVANLADEIAYYSHDLDDGLEHRLLDEKLLTKDVEVWAEAAAAVRRQFGSPAAESRRYYTIRQIIDQQVIDVVESTLRRIEDAGVGSVDEVRACRRPLVGYSTGRRKANLALRKYLYRNLYYNPVVAGPNDRAVRMLGQVFTAFLENPKLMGGTAIRDVAKIGLHRAVCDHVAGMTDRFVIQEHKRLFGLPVSP